MLFASRYFTSRCKVHHPLLITFRKNSHLSESMCMPLLFSHTLVFIICSVILTITLAFFGFMLHLTIQVLSHQGSHSVYVSVHIPEFGWLPSLWLLLQYSAMHLSMFILFNELLFFSFMLPVSICSPDKPYIVIIIFTFITITSIIAEHCNFYCVTIVAMYNVIGLRLPRCKLTCTNSLL